ncbi:MAG: Type 1 glutamine amidotransferase-like domain-containing protein [Gaiellaceae bacterium]
MAAARQIVGIGGSGDTPEQTLRLYDYVLALTGKERPKVLYVPTALADSTHTAEATISFYETYRERAEPSHLFTFPWPPANLRELILSQDAICVSGGNTANMLAIWRTHGVDGYLHEAWERGIVLWGASAEMICWFERGVTDSFGAELAAMDCLGFLEGSACPHYDGEERRRPRYVELVQDGLADGVAADDGVGLHYVDSELVEVVTCRPGAAAYRVTRSGESEPLTARLLQ